MFGTILNTVIFLTCCALGYASSRQYQCRVVNLQSFLDGFKNLEEEISYKKTPLPEALKRVSDEKCGNACQTLFSNVSEKLKSESNCSFHKCWSNSIVGFAEQFCLSSEDCRIVKELGNGLGGTDIHGQSAVIERTCNQLSLQLEQAVTDNATKGKMYKGLGVAVGLALVIILI